MSLLPYYQYNRVTLYLGKCEEVLPQLKLQEPFDLVLTDPPYGHGEMWSGGTWASNPIYQDAFDWDAERIDDSLLERVIQLGRKAIVWGGNYYSLPPSRCWLSWIKSSALDTLADFELAWTNFDRPSKKFTEDRNPDGKRFHPTQKPISLFEWSLIFADRPASVFDPFAGSGTTLIAAQRLGTKAVGIEASEKYCELAARRLSQGELFGAEA